MLKVNQVPFRPSGAALGSIEHNEVVFGHQGLSCKANESKSGCLKSEEILGYLWPSTFVFLIIFIL